MSSGIYANRSTTNLKNSSYGSSFSDNVGIVDGNQIQIIPENDTKQESSCDSNADVMNSVGVAR